MTASKPIDAATAAAEAAETAGTASARTPKVLMLNGSPHVHGNTNAALEEIGRALVAEGVAYEIVQIGAKPVRDCVACGACARLDNACAFGGDDGVNEFIDRAREASGFVFGTPTYYAHPSGSVLSFLDRVFYADQGAEAFRHKPAAAVAIARRGGNATSFDVMNKYFGISEMPVVSSTYWNIAYGRTPGEVARDAEGMQTMRNIGHNMAWLIKCIAAGREAGVALPATERGAWTHFIRES